MRHDEVEYEVGVRRTFHHSEVVHGKLRVNVLYQLADLFAQGVYVLVVNYYRIHVQNYVDGELFLYVALYAVDRVVARHYIAVGRHLYMGGGKGSSRAVVVNHEVVYADDPLVGEDVALYLAYRLGRGGRTEQLVHRVLEYAYSGRNDKQGYYYSHVPVERYGGKFRKNKGNHGHCCRRGVADAVHNDRSDGGRVYPLAYAAVEYRHPDFDSYRSYQHSERRRAELQGHGVHYLVYRRAYQLAAHDQDDKRDYERADILEPAVTERVLVVGGLICQTEADERHRGRARVRQVVRGVRRYGYTARYRADNEFCRGQQDIAYYSDNAA